MVSSVLPRIGFFRPGRYNSSGGIHDRAEAVLVEERGQIFSRSSLRSIARNQDVASWHNLSQHRAHLGVGRADNGSDLAVAIFSGQGRLRGPFRHLLPHDLIERAEMHIIHDFR